MPDWFRESEHAPENLAVLYRVVRRAGEAGRGGSGGDNGGGGEKWELVEPSTVKYNKVFLAFECRYLTRCAPESAADALLLVLIQVLCFCASVALSGSLHMKSKALSETVYNALKVREKHRLVELTRVEYLFMFVLFGSSKVKLTYLFKFTY